MASSWQLFFLQTAAELVSCTSWLLGLVLATWKWLRTTLGERSRWWRYHSFPPQNLAAGLHAGQLTVSSEECARSNTTSMIQLYATTFLQKELENCPECPIQMTPMLEPVRIIHEDEDVRVGQPAHIMDLEAANRWLFESPDSEARCPFCRGAVLQIQAERSEDLNATLIAIAEKIYTNSEGVIHKAVRLRDARLLGTLSRLLPASRWRELLLQKNAEGKLPFELLPEMMQSEEEISSFLQGLSLLVASDFEDFENVIVHSGLSARFADGCQVWSRQDPSDPRPLRPGEVALKSGSSAYYLLGSFCDQLIFLRDTGLQTCLCRAPLRAAFCQDARVPELYEPAMRIWLSNDLSALSFPRHRSIWIGGATYADDFVVSGAPKGAATLKFQEPSTWYLHAIAADLEIEEKSHVVMIKKNTSYKLPSNTIKVRIQPLGQEVTLRPCFSARRALSSDLVASLQEQLPCECDFSRPPLVLVHFQLELKDKASTGAHAVMFSEHIGAIVAQEPFTIGRRGASSLVIPMAGNLSASVSRHHCCVHLEGDHLVVFDAGSMCGTKLNGQVLGDTLASAHPLHQSDVLDMGQVRIRLAKVSPLIGADDETALAMFVGGVDHSVPNVVRRPLLIPPA